MQELLARPDKTECILGALLDPLTPAQISALKDAVKHYEEHHSEMKGWAKQWCNDDAPGSVEISLVRDDRKSNPGSVEISLVRDDRKSNDLPRARWATELDFCK
jgi:hypothetical protein